MTTKKNSFQLVSDLHIEFYQTPKIRDFFIPSAPNLIIAGDLGIPYMSSYTDFLTECSQTFEKVFLIAGNHEYYQGKNTGDEKWTMDRTDEEIHKITKRFNNVYFLQNTAMPLDDQYLIYGTTLWSKIPADQQTIVLRYMNSCRQIYKTIYETILPQDTDQIFDDNVKKLTSFIDQNKDKNVIIVTHHLPSYQLTQTKNKGHPMIYCFNSDLEHLMKPNVIYWISGHTHTNFNMKIGNCQCLVNPCGYKNENNGFIKDLVINLE